MNAISTAVNKGLPEEIEQLLQNLVQRARESFQDDLKMVALFGSGAEGSLRPTSDLNLLFILKRFEQERVDKFREPLRAARVAARAAAMFILESELVEAAEAFAVKFDDIARRHRILYGDDLLAKLPTPRSAKIQRLRQVLVNLKLRLRERYVVTSLREEQLAIVISEAAGPLRAAASTLCELEGSPAISPKEALEKFVAGLNNPKFSGVLDSITQARRTRSLPAGAAPQAVFQLVDLCEAMRLRTERLE